jgi:hypothetical protein
MFPDIWEDIYDGWDSMLEPIDFGDGGGRREKSRTPAVEPRNNDGRDDCYWCAGALRRMPGLSGHYDYCDKCKK